MPHSPQDTPTPREGRRAHYLWPLLAVFAVAVPAALIPLEKRSANLSWTFILIVLASLAGYAVAVDKIVQERLAESRRRTRLLVWLAAAVFYLGTVAVLIWFRPPPLLAKMVGLRAVAVAGFAATDVRQDQHVLDGFADEFAHSLKGQLPSATDVRSYAAEAGLPLTELPDSDRSSDLRDADRSRELEQKTAVFAEKTHALIVLAGLARTEGKQSKLHPAVYIRPNQIANLDELAGWYVGKPIAMPWGLDHQRQRDRLSKELTQQVGDLAKFLDAMEAWRTDDLAEARRILDSLPVSEPQAGRHGFVPPDLVLLFRGTAAEQQAAAETEPSRTKLLKTARENYLRIPEHTQVGRRAALSLQVNAYLRAFNPEKLCQPGTVQAAELAQASKRLKELANDKGLNRLGQLKAVVNLAQVEDCRIAANLVPDDGTVEWAVAELRKEPDATGTAALRAIAESIAANHAYRSGEKDKAIGYIWAAIADGQDPLQKALWHALLARWSLERCELVHIGEKAHEDAQAQFLLAEGMHRGNPKARKQDAEKFAKQLKDAEERCAVRGSSE
ncbi:hypothetical protein ACFWNR_27610 [Streptomyces virginiae]|uniref:hypothetical protein n=1 Tax=Streptomyces virginiae TaxID=1961 RepID=UPI00365398B6